MTQPGSDDDIRQRQLDQINEMERKAEERKRAGEGQ